MKNDQPKQIIKNKKQTEKNEYKMYYRLGRKVGVWTSQK